MALGALGIDTKNWDFVWVHILSEKLDAEIAREWQLSNADGKLKSMEQMKKFLERRARVLEGIWSLHVSQQEIEKTFAKVISRIQCLILKSHRIYTCPVFLALSVIERHERAN